MINFWTCQVRERELIALLSLSSWCLVIVVWLFLAVPWVCLQFVIVVFLDHTHLLFLSLQTLICPAEEKELILVKRWMQNLDLTAIMYALEAKIASRYESRDL